MPTLSNAEVDLVYDVHGPLPTADGRPPLLMIGQPMDAVGFTTLVSLMGERTCVTYDPRGIGRSVRKDGGDENVPAVQAEDLHRLVAELGAGPVEVLASSGGAITALVWVATYPQDVATLVAHEPPLLRVLPDVAVARPVWERVRRTYDERGWGAGMAAFIGLVSHSGAFTEAFLAEPTPDPAAFGMPDADDGSRDDPLLSKRSASVPETEVDVAAVLAAPTRVVVAVGEDTGETFTGRTSRALAARLGSQATEFPGGHTGFMGDEYGQPGKPEAFAERLREVLAAA